MERCTTRSISLVTAAPSRPARPHPHLPRAQTACQFHGICNAPNNGALIHDAPAAAYSLASGGDPGAAMGTDMTNAVDGLSVSTPSAPSAPSAPIQALVLPVAPPAPTTGNPSLLSPPLCCCPAPRGR